MPSPDTETDSRRHPSIDESGADMVDRAREMESVNAMLLAVFRYRELVRSLVMRDLRLKYRGSILGFFWSLLNPLLTIGVYWFAFTYIIRTSIDDFAFFLLLGILPWTFFVSATMMSTGSILEGSALLKSVAFPRAVLPISTVLFNLAQFVLTLAVFVPIMMLAYRVPLAGPMLLFPVFLALQVVFTIGLALLLSTGTAFFRDIRHLLDVSLALLFWLTPIVYDLVTVPERLRLPLLLSPMSPFVLAYRQILFRGMWPDQELWYVALTYSIVSIVIGTAVFVGSQGKLAEQL
jgi:ABC-type polysaccharide/polyol phosphate export permease